MYSSSGRLSLNETECKSDRIRWIERFPGYHYHDSPEGEDCLKKVVFLNKMGIFFGFSTATLDVIGISKPVGIANIALRYAMITGPLMAVGTTFGATTCLLTSYRGKDDTYNYFFGGFAAGIMAGAVNRNGVLGTVAAVGLGSFAYVKKYMNDIGWSLLPDDRPSIGWSGPWALKYDLSLTEERPRTWKKSEDEVL